MVRFVFIISLLLIVSITTVKSQDLPVHEQYFLDWTLVNPSFMGLTESTSFKLMHREQWIGIENSPRTSLFLFKRRIPDRTGGYGGYIFSDRNGPSSKHGFMFSWSYQAMLDVKRYDRLILSFGMSLKGLIHVLNESGFERHLYDPIIDYTSKTSFVPNANAGFLISYGNYFLGFSFENFFQYTDKLYDQILEPPPRVLMNAHSGVIFNLNHKMQIRPSALYKSNFGGLNQMDINAKFSVFSGKDVRSVFVRYENEFWIGLSYKHTLDYKNNAPLSLSPSFGFNIGSLTIAYLYDMGLTSLQLYHYGTHQLAIGYRIFPDKFTNWGKHNVPVFLDDF
jgi:type IX secretion system PorP/SprF family membrane protein